MRILKMINIYFVIFILIQSFVLIFIDSRTFEKANMSKIGSKAKIIGKTFTVAIIILFVIQLIL